MDIENSIEIKNNVNNDLNLENKQNVFLSSMLGKAINSRINIKLRTISPDFLEEQVIDIKDNFMNYGFKEGIRKTIDDTINIGKSAIGIITGNFENVEQMQTAVKSGGIIDSVSEIIDVTLDKMIQNRKVDNNIAKIIKQGKNTLLNSVESNIEKSFTKQINGVEKLENYISSWKQYYNQQDFNGMEKEHKKIKRELSNIVPLENTIKEARSVENLHTLIKNNGKNFDLSDTEKELIEKFK